MDCCKELGHWAGYRAEPCFDFEVQDIASSNSTGIVAITATSLLGLDTMVQYNSSPLSLQFCFLFLRSPFEILLLHCFIIVSCTAEFKLENWHEY